MMGPLITASFQTIFTYLIHILGTVLNEWAAIRYFAPPPMRGVSLCLLVQPKPCPESRINNFSLGFSKEHFNAIYDCLPNINQLLFTLQNEKVVHFPFYRQGAEAQKGGQKCPLIFRAQFDMPWTWLFTVLSIYAFNLLLLLNKVAAGGPLHFCISNL